jgi:hypothetical protein
MGWIYERDGHRLAEDDLTTGEWEHLYILVNRLGVPHREIDISPLHCPVCRSAIAIQAALKAGVPSVEAAAALLVDLPRGALPAAFTFTAPDRLDPSSVDVAQPGDLLDGDGVAAVV